MLRGAIGVQCANFFLTDGTTDVCVVILTIKDLHVNANTSVYFWLKMKSFNLSNDKNLEIN